MIGGGSSAKDFLQLHRVGRGPIRCWIFRSSWNGSLSMWRADGHDQLQPLTAGGGLPEGVADIRRETGDHRRGVQVIVPPSGGAILD